ncbi:hypothetical protein Slin14017_G093690 [Septoria linicola]|nr:hypothetical protein Slin14017_G093690 [Septoria linicola]
MSDLPEICGRCYQPFSDLCLPCFEETSHEHHLVTPPLAAPLSAPDMSSSPESSSRESTAAVHSGPASPVPALPKAKKVRAARKRIWEKNRDDALRQIQKNESQACHRAMSKQITALCKTNCLRGMARDRKVSSKASVLEWAEKYGLAWDGASDHFQLAQNATEVQVNHLGFFREMGYEVWENPYHARGDKNASLASFPRFWMKQ